MKIIIIVIIIADRVDSHGLLRHPGMTTTSSHGPISSDALTAIGTSSSTGVMDVHKIVSRLPVSARGVLV